MSVYLCLYVGRAALTSNKLKTPVNSWTLKSIVQVLRLILPTWMTEKDEKKC